MPSARPSWSVSIALAIVATVLPAQDRPTPDRPGPTGKASRLDQLVARSIDELGDSERRADALRRLENLGKLALPGLMQRIHWQKRNDYSRQQQADMLYVIGRLGRDGLPALGEIRAWVREGDREIAQQLIYTLCQLAPFFAPDQAASVRDDWRRALRSVPLSDVDVLMQQINLAGTPTQPQIETYLKRPFHGGAACIAICHWLIAHADEIGPGKDAAIDALEYRLELDTKREEVTFSRAPKRTEPFVAAALQALTAAPLDPICARALLTHPQPAQRLRATLWLGENGAPLPLLERADLVGRLWDGDPEVARGAADALGRWGRNGLVGLPALAWTLDRHRDPSVKKACSAAIAKVRDGLEGLQDRDRAWVVAGVDVLLDQNGWPPQAPPGPKGRAALAELLLLAQWGQAPRVARLLDLVDRSRPDEAQIGAVYSWLRRDDQVIADAALSFLARHAEFVDNAIEERGEANMRAEFTRLAVHWVTYPSRGTAFEAGAWVITHDMPFEDLIELLEQQNGRLTTRAMAELLLNHPERLDRVQPRLHTLSNHQGGLEWRTTPGHNWQSTSYQLSDQIRVLAALCLARKNVVARESKGLEALLQKYCAVSQHDLPQFVRESSDQELRALVERLERDCRRGLHVPEQLKWPRARER